MSRCPLHHCLDPCNPATLAAAFGRAKGTGEVAMHNATLSLGLRFNNGRDRVAADLVGATERNLPISLICYRINGEV